MGGEEAETFPINVTMKGRGERLGRLAGGWSGEFFVCSKFTPEWEGPDKEGQVEDSFRRVKGHLDGGT